MLTKSSGAQVSVNLPVLADLAAASISAEKEGWTVSKNVALAAGAKSLLAPVHGLVTRDFY